MQQLHDRGGRGFYVSLVLAPRPTAWGRIWGPRGAGCQGPNWNVPERQEGPTQR